ncbi:hypothetical protein V2J09_017496 [Rumex salicifolius]
MCPKFLFRLLGFTQLVFFVVSSEFDSFNGSFEFHKFKMVNRRKLSDCLININPFVEIQTSSSSGLISDEENITVTVTGISIPTENEWVAMVSPSHSNVDNCPFNAVLYKETGDLSHLPLLCHYPIKAANLKSDPDYLSCNKSECKKASEIGCEVKTCSASVTFHVINIRTDIEFILFSGGFDTPCVLKRTKPLTFSNPNKPLYGHLSSIDSTATAMRLTWVSGSKFPQEVQYGDGKSQKSQAFTFTQGDVCGIASAAKDFGWHDPGYIHTAILTGLQPSSNFSYKYGSDLTGWSEQIRARTPPAGGSDAVKIIAFGDMGKAPLDNSIEHYIQPGSISVTSALANEVAMGNVDAIFHIGDISYATGFLVEWDYFLHLINPIAKHISYMTAIGNHERMPTSAKDKPWYSIEIGSVHFTVISTEHDWKLYSEQYEWMKNDMAAVNRSRTPWLVFAGHRPMYTTSESAVLGVDPLFVGVVEPLLLKNKVDVAIFGHVHNYERTCAVYREDCKSMPMKDDKGIDIFDDTEYTAPVQAVIGMAGFSLDKFGLSDKKWSLSKISKYGYSRIHATRKELKFEVSLNTMNTAIEAAGSF